MKILFTGGGSGGHFYPIIAVAEEIKKISKEKRLLDPKLYFVAPEPYNKGILFENGIEFRRASAGKLRRYFSIFNFFDLFKTGFGLVKSIWQLYSIFPDVVFGKGGYASFPALFAARILKIPVVIHESDSVPGKVNAWAGKFAKRVAISYPSAAKYFKEETIALTGNPIRKEMLTQQKEGAHEFLKLQRGIPVILILGGSLGAKKINDTLLAILPGLVKKYQIIHQTGKENFKEMEQTAGVVLNDSTDKDKDRYHPFAYLNTLAMKMAYGAADLVISRAGSTIFEIAVNGLPSIIVPLADSNRDHQRKNAFAYARSGACLVMEEKNLAPNILLSDINRLMENEDERNTMGKSAKEFAKSDAAKKIANEIINLALAHEK